MKNDWVVIASFTQKPSDESLRMLQRLLGEAAHSAGANLLTISGESDDPFVYAATHKLLDNAD